MKKGREKIKVEMPTGVSIVDRPEGLDLLLRSKNKWVGVIQNLETLEATKCVTIDLGDMMEMSHVNAKSRLTSIKSGIKHTAKTIGFKPRIKFALKDNKLFIWTN